MPLTKGRDLLARAAAGPEDIRLLKSARPEDRLDSPGDGALSCPKSSAAQDSATVMQPNSTSRIPLWHSLMYATGTLLLVCGIPATVLLSVLFTNDRSRHLTGLDGLWLCVCMVLAEALIAGVLLFAAEKIAKRGSGPEPRP